MIKMTIKWNFAQCSLCTRKILKRIIPVSLHIVYLIARCCCMVVSLFLCFIFRFQIPLIFPLLFLAVCGENLFIVFGEDVNKGNRTGESEARERERERENGFACLTSITLENDMHVTLTHKRTQLKCSNPPLGWKLNTDYFTIYAHAHKYFLHIII